MKDEAPGYPEHRISGLGIRTTSESVSTERTDPAPAPSLPVGYLETRLPQQVAHDGIRAAWQKRQQW